MADTPTPATPVQPASAVPTAVPTPTTDPNAYLTDKKVPDDISSTWRRTKCLVCGFVYEGNKTLEKCPKCGNIDKDKFQETD